MKKKHSKKKEHEHKHSHKPKKEEQKEKKPFVAPDFSRIVQPEKRIRPKGRPIVNALHELRNTIKKIVLCSCLLDSFIIFMFCLLILALVSVEWYFALIPALIYSVIHTKNYLKKTDNFRYAEQKVPELKEKIITVADNLSRDNPIIAGLNEDVLKGMHLIRTSYFFSFSRLTRELITLTVLSFLIIGVSAYGVRFIDFRGVIDEIGDLRVFNKGKYDVNADLLEYEENLSEDIYGDKSIAILGNEELKLQLNPVLSDVDISKVQDPEHRKFRSVVPREISARTDSSFEDSIPKDYHKIVKTYFREITKT
jgi:ABC-type multidrug transport system fused ATPase/permease subunit